MVFFILCQRIWCHCSNRLFPYITLNIFFAILYPTSLANLVVEVGTRHSHQVLLKVGHEAISPGKAHMGDMPYLNNTFQLRTYWRQATVMVLCSCIYGLLPSVPSAIMSILVRCEIDWLIKLPCHTIDHHSFTWNRNHVSCKFVHENLIKLPSLNSLSHEASLLTHFPVLMDKWVNEAWRNNCIFMSWSESTTASNLVDTGGSPHFLPSPARVWGHMHFKLTKG